MSSSPNEIEKVRIRAGLCPLCAIPIGTKNFCTNSFLCAHCYRGVIAKEIKRAAKERKDVAGDDLEESISKNRSRFQKSLLRWIKANTTCKRCGTRENLTFHHVHERRNGGKVLSCLAGRPWARFVAELLKGEFLCQPCHFKLHAEERAKSE